MVDGGGLMKRAMYFTRVHYMISGRSLVPAADTNYSSTGSGTKTETQRELITVVVLRINISTGRYTMYVINLSTMG